MKKFILLVIICLSSINIYSQEFEGGFVAGLNFSQIDGDNYAGFNKLGIVGGVYAARAINKNWKAQFEILYSQKGSRKAPEHSKGDYSEYKCQLDYIEIPIFVSYGYRKFRASGGISLGSLIRSKEEDQYGEFDANEFEDFQWETLIGISYDITPRISADIRWEYSISRIRKAYDGDYDWQEHPIWGDKFGQYDHTISLVMHYKLDSLFQ